MKGTVIAPTETDSSLPMHALGMNGNGYVVIPKWFVSFLSFTVSVIFVGAILWAWQMSSDMASIKAEVRAQNELRTERTNCTAVYFRDTLSDNSRLQTALSLSDPEQHASRLPTHQSETVAMRLIAYSRRFR